MTTEFLPGENRVRARWAASETAFGALLGLPTSSSAYIVGQAGFDWVVIEQQHAYASQASLLPLLHALELGGALPVIRVGENDPIGIQRALDLGARGIIAPMVNTREQAEAVRVNTRFPPLGERSWGAPRTHATPGAANEDVVVMVMVETPQAVGNLAEILSVPGIDGVVVGPSDLAMNMGLEPQAGASDPLVWEAFETVGRGCRERGKHFGSFVTDPEVARRMVDVGADFILFSSDVGHVSNGVAADRKTIESMRKRAG